jgi:hypothetical protein
MNYFDEGAMDSETNRPEEVWPGVFPAYDYVLPSHQMMA